MTSITINFVAPQVPCVSIIADTDVEETKMILLAQKMLEAIEAGNVEN